MTRFWKIFRRWRGRTATPVQAGVVSYKELYEYHARHSPEQDAVGGGPYDQIGQTELNLLKAEGLLPSHSLVDFGCGTGRLAQFAIRYLSGGEYTGIDISRTFLRKAEDLGSRIGPAAARRVSWVEQPSETRFPLEDGSADMICAFSVFTHMEHEDTFRYLVDAMRVLRPGGRLIFSCLPLDLQFAQEIFVAEARMSLGERWQRPRNVVTSRDTIASVCRLAGWSILRWYPGDVACIPNGKGGASTLGQTACVCEAAR